MINQIHSGFVSTPGVRDWKGIEIENADSIHFSDGMDTLSPDPMWEGFAKSEYLAIFERVC